MSLNGKVKSTIKTLHQINRESNMLAINATISANLINSAEGRVFKVLAQEIRRLSERTGGDVKNLETVLDEINELSFVINKAGSLRMMSQKHLKLVFISRQFEGDGAIKGLQDTEEYFYSAIIELKALKFTNEPTQLHLDKLKETFTIYLNASKGEITEEVLALNDTVLEDAKTLVQMYEDTLSGKK